MALSKLLLNWYSLQKFFPVSFTLSKIAHLIFLLINLICFTVTTTTPPPGKEWPGMKIYHTDLLVYNSNNRACHSIELLSPQNVHTFRFLSYR